MSEYAIEVVRYREDGREVEIQEDVFRRHSLEQAFYERRRRLREVDQRTHTVRIIGPKGERL